MGLPVLKRAKTGPSTSAEVLERLTAYPIVNLVLEYRQVSFAQPMPMLVSRRSLTTGHQQLPSERDRDWAALKFGSNLQNIPVRTSAGRRIRKHFVAPEEPVNECRLFSDRTQGAGPYFW